MNAERARSVKTKARRHASVEGGSWLIWGSRAEWAVLFLGCIYLLRAFNLKPLLGDEGVAAMDAWRIASGQIPGRDFFEIIPPFSFLPTAAAFRLLGASVLAERLTALFWGCALLLLTAGLLRRFVNNPWIRAGGLCLLVPFGVGSWPIPSHHWVSVVLQLAAILALDKMAETSNHWWAVLSGVLASLACFTLQDQGAYLVAALLVFYFPLLPPRTSKARLFSLWATGGIAVAAAFAFWLLPRVSLADLAYQWVTFPAHAYRTLPGHSAGFFAGWEQLSHLWAPSFFWSQPLSAASMTIINLSIFFLPFTGLAAILLAWRKRWLPAHQAGMLLALSLAFIGSCAHRWALSNLTWAATASLVPTMVALDRGIAAKLRWVRVMARGASGLIAASSLCAGVVILCHSTSYEHTFPIVAPAGTLRSGDPYVANDIQQAVSAIDLMVPKNGGLVCTGFTPLMNFLTLRHNPTPLNFLWYPEYDTPEQIQSVMAILSHDGRTWVLLTRPTRPSTPFEQFVARNYNPVWSNDMFILMKPEFRKYLASPQSSPPSRP